MTEINAKIIEMIGKNASANEIAQAVGMTNKQLFYRLNLLKNKGYNFKTKYYYNGDIVYKLVKDFSDQDDTYTILTSKDDTEFKALLISDLHLASIKDRVDLLDKMYNYCINEGIHIIINAGDLIDGLLGPDKKKFTNPEDQINYALKEFPSDKNIINFVCLGNHDYSSLKELGFDIANSLRSRRHDIVPIGYGIGKINVKNDQIIIRHSINKKINGEIINNKLIINGHTHKMSTINGGGNINLYLPSLSDIKVSDNEILPGAVKTNISFNNGYFSVGVFEHLLISKDRIYKISESQYEMNRGKNTNETIIKNEEERIQLQDGPQKVLELKKDNNRPSQIDKFNKRYNI